MAKKKGSRVIIRVIALLIFAFVAIIFIFINANGAINELHIKRALNDWWSGVQNISLQPKTGVNLDSADIKYKFAIISDSHEDTNVYPKIVSQIASRSDLAFVVHLGDQSNAGEEQKLIQSKATLDTISAPVYVLPGDHDRNWVPQRDLTNFKRVFGLSRTSYSIEKGSEKFIFLDNSDGGDGISEEAWSWLRGELNTASNYNIYIFMSTPLSNPYLTFKAMGSQSEKVKTQAAELGRLLKDYKVRAIFAGDTHTFSQYKDRETGIPIITAGAAGANKNPLPLYVLVDILSDGSYNVSSVPLRQ